MNLKKHFTRFIVAGSIAGIAGCGQRIEMRSFDGDSADDVCNEPSVQISMECGTVARVDFMIEGTRRITVNDYSVTIVRRWSQISGRPQNRTEAFLDDLITTQQIIAQVPSTVLENPIPVSFFSPVLQEIVHCPCFNIVNLSRVLALFGTPEITNEWDRRSDYDRNGVIDLTDLAIVLTHFGNCGY